MKRRPDFIMIGAMKSATTTLRRQLARQPGIFVTEETYEPSFFSDDDIYARGLDWYQGLFDAAAPDALCGECSTNYTKLPTHPDTVSRMRADLDDVRLIYMMRHPIDRLISQYIHEWSQRVIDVPIDEAIQQHPQLIAYSRYAMQLEPYLEAYGAERILPMFFERCIAEPQAELERVCAFIGHPSAPQWDSELDAQNVSSQRMRRSPVRDMVVDQPILRKLRRTLVPQGVRDWLKTFWQMKERPELSAKSQAHLVTIFDDDLAALGDRLGIKLNCTNFKDVARTARGPLLAGSATT